MGVSLEKTIESKRKEAVDIFKQDLKAIEEKVSEHMGVYVANQNVVEITRLLKKKSEMLRVMRQESSQCNQQYFAEKAATTKLRSELTRQKQEQRFLDDQVVNAEINKEKFQICRDEVDQERSKLASEVADLKISNKFNHDIDKQLDAA